ncbi:MAG TPA: aldo/keto reductase [Verrucomicrobiae bacterium]|nr:aldo/keto reductase [Verrucomicrobiae bacterium]
MSEQNRRDFLKCGAIFGATVATTSLIPTESEASPKTTQQNRPGSKTRILGSGKNTIEVNYGLGLGCMGMSWNRSFVPERDKMIALIRKAYDLNVNLFDTAEAYGPYLNEELVGEAIEPFRKKVTLCSKFGFEFQNGKMTGGFNSQPKHIKEVVDQSLKRLRTDYIDLLYQHRVDPNVPMEDVAGAVKDLIAEGKVKHFGLSEAGATSIRKAHAVQPVTALQSEFSLMTRDPLEDVIPVCQELGIGFVPYSPLCRAYLTGYINDMTTYVAGNDNRPTLPRYKPEAVRANWKIVAALQDFGNKRGVTAAQLALAWLSAQKPWIVPIPGTTKLAHLQENLWSSDFTFTPEELVTLTAEVTAIPITGERYPTPQTR